VSGLPKNVDEHVSAMAKRQDYTGFAEFTLVGIDGPACLLGKFSNVVPRGREHSEADGYQSFLHRVLSKELSRAEARAAGRAFRQALKLLQSVHDEDGRRVALTTLQGLAGEADAGDIYTINVAKSLPNAERVELLKSYEREVGVGRVRIKVLD
jgi:hypothetical protein